MHAHALRDELALIRLLFDSGRHESAVSRLDRLYSIIDAEAQAEDRYHDYAADLAEHAAA